MNRADGTVGVIEDGAQEHRDARHFSDFLDGDEHHEPWCASAAARGEAGSHHFHPDSREDERGPRGNATNRFRVRAGR